MESEGTLERVIDADLDPDLTVEAFVEKTAKEMGAPIKVVGFIRLALGEGVEKKEDDFASEVAALTAGA